MNKKVSTSLKIQPAVEQQMLQQVIIDGYGMRGKSRWIVEAIEQFLSLPDYPELVNIAGEVGHLTKVVSVRLSEIIAAKLDHALIEVRMKFPDIEGVQSNIIRASIMQKLIRHQKC